VLALWATSRSASAVTQDTPEGVEAVLGSLFVAELDGEIVGALIAAFDGWRGNMYRLAVRLEFRRRGIAQELVDAGHAHLRAQGVRRVTALVGDDEGAAVGLWRAAGYQYDPAHIRFVRNL
jgi:ribosomal protein S18 acetylase RimI-like enzyme